MERVAEFIFLGSKTIADGDCSHKIKICLLLGRKAMTNLDSVLKSRDITLPTKVYLVKAMVFPVVMYGCESWTIKKAKSQRIDAFKLWCWSRLLRVPWTARRQNQSILKEISPDIHWKDWCWSWNSNTWPPDAKNLLTGKDPDAGKRLRVGEEGDNRGWDGWMASPTQWTWVWVSSRSWWWTGRPGVGKSRTGQSDGTEPLYTDSEPFQATSILKILGFEELDQCEVLTTRFVPTKFLHWILTFVKTSGWLWEHSLYGGDELG